ncbi:MAG: hypothetical protein WD934_07915 [Gemmatimonadales bacterium]
MNDYLQSSNRRIYAVGDVALERKECHERGFPFKTFTVPMSDVARAVLDGEEEGFVKISLAMVAGIGLKTVSQVIRAYPTQAEAIRKAGDAYTRTRLSPFLKTLSSRWLAWSR